MTEQSTDALPTPCPQCDVMLESRDDVLVHAIAHVGDDDA